MNINDIKVINALLKERDEAHEMLCTAGSMRRADIVKAVANMGLSELVAMVTEFHQAKLEQTEDDLKDMGVTL